jgi:hypothetical protein
MSRDLTSPIAACKEPESKRKEEIESSSVEIQRDFPDDKKKLQAGVRVGSLLEIRSTFLIESLAEERKRHNTISEDKWSENHSSSCG